MGRKLRTDQYGVFPGLPNEERFRERDRVISRELAKRAGLPSPERAAYENLGNRELPVYRNKEEIQRAIRDHQISMVEGPTGSGKSTQIAQYALEMGYKKVVYLEPRVLLADNLSDRIESELAQQLGANTAEQLIGVRHSERSTGKGKQIEVMTPATFMRVSGEIDAFEDEPVLFVGDEIHEKDFETELGVATIAQKLKHHSKWRLLLASATLDAKPIHDAYTEMNGRDIPLVSVEGRPHDLTTYSEPELDVVEAYLQYSQDHEKTMIFTAGKAEIKEITKALRAANLGNVRIDPLHSKLPYDEIKRATHARLNEGQRQIIVSTSAGQSGITVPGLTLVISDGTTRRPDLDVDGTPGLFKELCTQDELTQQAGRAGRDVAGGEFVLARSTGYDGEFVPLDERPSHAPAQIYSTNISRNVLLASSFDANFYELNKLLIHKVKDRPILEAYEVLYRLSAHDEYNQITEIGQAMNQFPLRPELSRALTAAVDANAPFAVLQHLTAVVSSIEAGGLPYFEKGVGEEWRKDVRLETKDDYIAQLDMFYATRELFDHSRIDERELKKRNYDPKNSYRAHKTFDKIMRTLRLPERDIDISPPTEDEEEMIRDFLTAGLFDFAHQFVTSGAQKGVHFSRLHDKYDQVPRELSSRGTYKGRDNLVIGMPRRFEKKTKGVLTEHSTIENVFPTTKDKLARHVLHLLDRKSAASSRVVGGHLKRTDELYFGPLKMQETDSISRLTHTPETRKQLREAAYKKPTQALGELVSIKRELEKLERVTPKDRINEFFPTGIMTSGFLDMMIDELITAEVTTIYELDNKLRTRMILDEISVSTWISESKRAELAQISPEDIEISPGLHYRLSYSHGKPCIYGINLQDIATLPLDGLFLDDGREVLISFNMFKDTKKYTVPELREYISGLHKK